MVPESWSGLLISSWQQKETVTRKQNLRTRGKKTQISFINKKTQHTNITDNLHLESWLMIPWCCIGGSHPETSNWMHKWHISMTLKMVLVTSIVAEVKSTTNQIYGNLQSHPDPSSYFSKLHCNLFRGKLSTETHVPLTWRTPAVSTGSWQNLKDVLH